MRFEEIYGGCQARRLAQGEVACLLGVCERTFRRYVDRYEEEGLDGLVDKRLGQVSARRAPVDEVLRTEALYHEGWNVKPIVSSTRPPSPRRATRRLSFSRSLVRPLPSHESPNRASRSPRRLVPWS